VYAIQISAQIIQLKVNIMNTVSHATNSEIDSKFERIKNDLWDLKRDSLESSTHRQQERDLFERNDGTTNDPFDEVELRGMIYQTDLDEITDEEKCWLIEELESYSGINSEHWHNSKLKIIISKFD
jgi:hypothetical protein